MASKAQHLMERSVEDYLRRRVTEMHGICLKFTSPGLSGVPDRIIIYNGAVLFAELKRPGGKPRPQQKFVADWLRKAGARVYCLSDKDQVDRFLAELIDHGYPDPTSYDEI